MESQTQQHRSQIPIIQNFNIPKQRGTGGRWECQWQRAYQRRPTPLETQEKRQRQKHVPHWQQFTRARFPVVDSRDNLDASQSN